MPGQSLIPGSIWTAGARFESGFWRKGPIEMIVESTGKQATLKEILVKTHLITSLFLCHGKALGGEEPEESRDELMKLPASTSAKTALQAGCFLTKSHSL